MQLYCVMAGAPIDDVTSDELLLVAYQMVSTMRARKKFKSSSCEGQVKTSFSTTGFGTVSGMLFHAFLESDTGTFEVQYLVRQKDLEHMELDDSPCAWVSPEELTAGPIPSERFIPNPIFRNRKVRASS